MKITKAHDKRITQERQNTMTDKAVHDRLRMPNEDD